VRGVYNGIQWKGTGNNRKSSRWVISILRSVLSRCQQEFALDFLLMSVRIPIIPGLVFAYVRQMERRIGKAFIRRCDSGVNEVLAVGSGIKAGRFGPLLALPCHALERALMSRDSTLADRTGRFLLLSGFGCLI